MNANDMALGSAFAGLAGRKALFVVGEVKGVDGDVASVELSGGLVLDDVRLTAVSGVGNKGVLVTPKDGSMVLMADLSNGERREMVAIAYSEVDSIEVHGGENGGMVNIGKLKEWMRNVENDLATLTQLLSTSVVAGNGAPLGIVFNPSTKSVESDIEDENVKH